MQSIAVHKCPLVLRAANNGFKKQINAGQLKISYSKRGVGGGGGGDCGGCVIVLFVSEVKKPWTTAPKERKAALFGISFPQTLK